MKNFTKFMSAAVLAAATMSLSGCQDEDFGYTASEIREHANFVEVFGKPDPTHTWSTAEFRYINVDVKYPAFFDSYQCRVWTADPSRTKTNLYYMADLRVENGQTSKVGIDCPADLQTVYVSLTDDKGGTVVKPATFNKEGNASVVFGEMTRANIHLDVVNAQKGVDFDVDVYYHDKNAADNSDWEAALPQGSDGWGYFSKTKYDSFIKVFPENGGNVQNPPCSSFVFESKGEDLVLYPFYAVTDGVSTNKVVFWVYNPADNISYSDIVLNYEPTVLMPAGSMEIVGKAPGSFANYNEMYRASYGATDTKSRPYIIHGVPAGWRIIFALETASEGYFYSIKELNDPSNSKSQNTIGSEFTKGEKYSMAGTATIGADTYLAFEDTWYNGQYDCQDMAFAVYGAKAVDMNVGGGEAMGFVIAYEDLGSTLDMDYNDIVIRVEHITNSSAAEDAEKDVTVSLLAAGGTMPVVPMYKDRAIFAGKGADTGNTGEAHTVFGYPTDTPVNAGGSTESATPVNSTIRVKEISPITTVAADIVMNLNDGNETMKYTNPQAWGVTDPEEGDHKDNVPYAILISDPNWKWPSENTLISSVYPGFKTWVTNHSTAQNWYDAEWQQAEIDTPTGDVVGIIANTTFYESQSIANIDPDFLNEYCTNGTTLNFVFENATTGATFTLKSESGSLSKEGTIDATGKAAIELSGDDFKKIYYKNGTSGEKNTYYLITVFATKYGVSFGTEAEFQESDVNGTNVISDLIPEDGEVVSLTDGNKLANSIVTSYEAIQFTIRAENITPSAALKNVYSAEIKKFCEDNGFLSSYVTVVPGRTGIYRISITKKDLDILYNNTDLVFVGFTNLSVAIKGLRSAGLAASNYTLGCNKSNIDLFANGTITSNSTGAITITTESDKVTINGTSISTGTVSESTQVTLNISQAAAGNYAAAQTTMALTIDPSALDPATLSVSRGSLNLTKGGNANISSSGASYNPGANTTGAISYQVKAEDSQYISIVDGVVTALKVTPEGYNATIQIVQAADASHYGTTFDYIYVTVEGAAKQALVAGQEYRLTSTYVTTDNNGAYIYRADLSSYELPANYSSVTVKVNLPCVMNYGASLNYVSDSTHDIYNRWFANSDGQGNNPQTFTITEKAKIEYMLSDEGFEIKYNDLNSSLETKGPEYAKPTSVVFIINE